MRRQSSRNTTTCIDAPIRQAYRTQKTVPNWMVNMGKERATRGCIFLSALLLGPIVPMTANAATALRSCPVDVSRAANRIDTSGNVMTPELSPYELVSNAVAVAYSCTYSGYEVTMGADGSVREIVLYTTQPVDRDKLGLIANKAAPQLLVLARNGTTPRYVAEQVQAMFEKKLETLGSAETWIDPRGVPHLKVYNQPANQVLDTQQYATVGLTSTERGLAAEAHAVIERVREDAGGVTVSHTDYNPERGGNVRVIDHPPGVSDGVCTSGPEFWVAGNYHGSIAGHCGPAGYGVWSGGMTAFLNPIANGCGYYGGTCYADVGIYQRSNPSGQTYIDNGTVRYVSSVGGSGGPPVGLTLCYWGWGTWNATGFGLRCGTVESSNNTRSYDGLTVLHAFRLNGGASIGGDSGGLVYEPLNPNKARVWGSVSGYQGSLSVHSSVYWAAYSLGGSVVVCGC
jgi:hypothetical protein